MKLVFDAEWKTDMGADFFGGIEHLWCVVFKELDKDNWFVFKHGDNMGKVKDFLFEQDNLTLIGHNILGADLEVFRRLLGIDFTVGRDTIARKECQFIDTMVMSRIYNPDRPSVGKLSPHGLAAWAVRLQGIKPIVEDWKNLSIEEYCFRCKKDVELTEMVYNELTEKERVRC